MLTVHCAAMTATISERTLPRLLPPLVNLAPPGVIVIVIAIVKADARDVPDSAIPLVVEARVDNF